MTTKYQGGYFLLDSPLIRTGLHTHTKALDAPVSQATLDALNAVQRTPWRINGWLLDQMLEVYRSGSRMHERIGRVLQGTLGPRVAGLAALGVPA